VAVTFGETGQTVDTTGRVYDVRVHSPLYAGALKDGQLYTVTFPVKKAGAYQMPVVVRDRNSAQLGSATQFIEVPDVKLGRLALSSIVPERSSERPETEGQLAESNRQGSAAVRVFRPGSSVHHAYQILNGRAGPNGQPALESQVRLFCNGRELYTGKFTALSVDGRPDTKRLETGGDLTLSGKLIPGDYVLQIIVIDDLAPEKYQAASQWMDSQVQ
jgi:hypothetical protein